jgi:hypothetical protein
VRGALQIRRVIRGGEGVEAGLTLFHSGRQGVIGDLAEDLAYFRRKTLCDFGAEVYRKTTGDLGLGKSSGKKQRLVARLAGERGELK